MSDTRKKSPQTVALYPAQLAHLEEMVRAHDLPDVSKAIRCLVNYSLQEEAHRDAIYKKVRCGTCS